MSETPRDWRDLPAFDDRNGLRNGWPWCPKHSDDPDFQEPDFIAPPRRFDSLPQVVVVTPSFHQAEYVEETIRSVLLQRYPRLCYRVRDAASDDGTGDILERYRPYFDELIIAADDGQSGAIADAIEGDQEGWFGWINSDDRLEPHTLWRLANALNGRDRLPDLVTFDVRCIGDGEPYVMRNENLSATAMLRDDRYAIAQPGWWFRLNRLHECGGIRRTLQYGFDWDLMVRYLALDPHWYGDPHIGATFRVHADSKTASESGSSINRFNVEAERIRDLLENEMPEPLVRASKLGRRRKPWHDRLIQALDDYEASPLVSTTRLAIDAMKDPPARITMRTLATMGRLLSRYVRPRHAWDKTLGS